jgi:hypothetical protein
VEDSKKLRDENAALNLELGNLMSENQAARKQAEAALAAAERIRMFAHQAGEVVAKAEGGAVRREGRDRIKAIRNPDSLDPDRLLGEVGEGFGGHEGSCESGHQPEKVARATRLGSVKLQWGSEPLQAFTSRKLQRTSECGRLHWRGRDVRVKGRPRTKGRKEGQEPRKERPGRDHDFHVQGRRIRIRRGPLSDTGSPPEAWFEGL